MVHRLLAAAHLVLAVAVLARVGAMVRNQDYERPAVLFGATIVATALWCGTTAPVLVAGSAWGPVALAARDAFRFIAVALWVAFVVEYADYRGRYSTAIRGVAAGYAVLACGLVATNAVHGAVYPGFVTDAVAGHAVVRPVRGAGFWTALFGMHLLFVASAGVFLQRFMTNGYVTVPQSVALLTLLFVMPNVDLLGFLLLEPALGFTPVPLVVLVVSLVNTTILDRQDLLSIRPVALDSAIDGADEAIVVLRDGKVVDFNDAAREFLDDDPLGREGTTVLWPSIASLDPVAEGRPGEATLSVEEGEPRHFSVRVSELSGPTGRNAVVVVLADVTDLKRRERELQRENERLETFTSTVSHDLRNPLGVAQGYLPLLREDDARERAIDEIETSLDRMEEMITDLLELARQGESVGDTEPVDVAVAATEAWGVVDTHDATLTVEADRVVRADPDRLANLFENLFRNAIDHVGPGVTVSVGSHDDGFYVADDGPGIDPAEREAVFERGYTDREDGTGFGLSIVAEIVAVHDWEIDVAESDRGGARFEVTTGSSAVEAPDAGGDVASSATD